MQIADYCREIETHLCRKNDGHLIRVTGPSFVLVEGWAARGVPLKVALAGIDRYFERYYRQGPRRRPVKVDFCEADVLDVFDEWRRATGVTSAAIEEGAAEGGPSKESLPQHLQRVVMRLSSARANGSIDDRFDALIDRASIELETARSKAGGLRGDARQAAIDRLNILDRELLDRARSMLDDATQSALMREAEEELASFRAGMAPDAYARAREGAAARLIRERFGLPTIAFHP